MDLTPIIEHLESEGLGTPGKTLFAHFMPHEATDAIMVRLPLRGVDVDPNLPGYFKTRLTAIVRSTEFVAGAAKAQEMMRALTVYDQQVGDIYVKRMYPCSLPTPYPLSDGNLYEIQVNVDIVFVGEAYGR